MQKIPIPWWAKITAKLILARFPFDYGFWKKLGLFQHGKMDHSTYAVDVFNNHTRRAGLTKKLNNKKILELGPGDAISTALIAYGHGTQSMLLD